MINYIKADIYRSLNKVSYWVYTAIFAAISVAFTIVLYSIHREIPSINLNSVSIAIPYVFISPVYIIIFFIEVVTEDEERNGTLKNVVSYGVSRNTVVISKVISTVILSIISALIILGIFSISILILFVGEKYVLIEFIKRCLLASVLWAGAISFGTFLYLIINGSMSAVIYIFSFLMAKNIIAFLTILVSDKLKYLNEILISNKLKIIASEPLTMNNVGPALLVGIMYIVVFTGLGMIYLKNKEIK